ncbi:hypothetical protein [Nannocystis pusilla]
MSIASSSMRADFSLKSRTLALPTTGRSGGALVGRTHNGVWDMS